jgi:ParB-like chromosome segregation protein Spo0J
VKIKLAKSVKIKKISSLKFSENNARIHGQKQISDIASSIKTFGFTNPVLINQEGVIIAGHGRVEAAKSIGLLEVPTIEIDYLTEAQRRALVIADNKIALDASWDTEQLASEMFWLTEEGFDLDTAGLSSLLEDEQPEGQEKDHETPAGYSEQFAVIVYCDTEEQQAKTYEKLTDKGYEVRVVKT